MRAIAKDISLRGWIALVASVGAIALLAGDAFTLLTGPRYVELPLVNSRAVNEATAALDERGLRWRLEQDGRLRVEHPRLTEARSVLAREGVLASPKEAAQAADDVTPEAGYAAALQRQTNQLLAETVGEGRATVAIDVDLDLNRRSERRLRYGKDSKVLRRRLETWRLEGTFARGSGRYESSARGVDRTVRSTRFAVGAVDRLTAALVVDPDMPLSDVRALRRAVRSALAIDRRRGDVLSVSRVAVTAPAPKSRASWGGLQLKSALPWSVLLLGIAVFLFEVWRCLRRQPQPPHEAAWPAPTS